MKKIIKKISIVLITCLLFVVTLVPNKVITVDAKYEMSTLTYDFEYCQSDARAMLKMINDFRTGSDAWQYDQSGNKEYIKGLSALKYDYELEKVAMQRAAELVLSVLDSSKPYGPVLRPNGTYLTHLMKEYGTFGYASENIYKDISGSMTTTQVFEYWKESNANNYDGQGFRRNMLSQNYKTVGIACVEYAGRLHWVQVFSDAEWNTTKATSALDAAKASKVDVYDDEIMAFIKRLYKLCLNRNYDSRGLTYWWTNLYTKQVSAAEATKGFFLSKEMTNMKLSDSEFVERCYKVMMDRNSEANGKKYWLERLSNGVGREYVLKGFIDSKEFTAICNKYNLEKGGISVAEARSKNYGITSFVVRCYAKALGRKYDVYGLNYWCNQLLNSNNIKQAAINVASNGFFHSQEFRNRNLNNTEYIKVLYQTFLGREYDKNGLNYWLKELNSGKSVDYVLSGFANSKEFSNIMASYGIK